MKTITINSHKMKTIKLAKSGKARQPKAKRKELEHQDIELEELYEVWRHDGSDRYVGCSTSLDEAKRIMLDDVMEVHNMFKAPNASMLYLFESYFVKKVLKVKHA